MRFETRVHQKGEVKPEGVCLASGLNAGHGTLLDATGRATPVFGRLEGEVLVYEVDATTVGAAVFPVVLDPLVSAEVSIMPRALGRSGYDQVELAVAASNSQHLVVWEDARSGNFEIWGTRVATSGPLDGPGLRLSQGVDRRSAPRVASDGTDFLVAWADERAPAGAIRFTRVRADGAVLDPMGVALATTGVGNSVDVAFTGTEYVLVWVENSSNQTTSVVKAGRVRTDGSRLDGDGVVLAGPGGARRFFPRVTATGSRLAFAWLEGDPLVVRLACATAALTSPTLSSFTGVTQVTGPVPGYGRIGLTNDRAAAARGYLSWSRGVAVDQRVFSMQTCAPEAALPALTTNPSPRAVRQSMFDGTSFVTVFDDEMTNGLYAVAATSTGGSGPVRQVVDRSAFEFYSGAAASATGEVLVAWGDQPPGELHTAFAQRLGPAPALLPLGAPFELTSAPAARRQPVVAWSPRKAHFLVAWAEATPTGSDVMGALVDRSGLVIAGPSPLIATPGADTRPTVAASGSVFLVAASSNQQLAMAMVDALGGAVLPFDAGMTPFVEKLALAGDDEGFALAWVEPLSTRPAFVQRFDPQGARQGRTERMANGVANIALAAGNAHLVAWESNLTTPNRVFVGRLGDAGLIDDAGVLPSNAQPQQSPAMASAPTASLVVWVENFRVVARLLRPDGTIDPRFSTLVLTPSPVDDHLAPTVAWDGFRFVVTWMRGPPPTYLDFSLQGVVVDLDGGQSEPFTLSDTPEDERHPALAGADRGLTLAAYERFEGASRDVYLRQVRLEVGQPCTTAAQCPSGLCVDGVCCDSECGGGADDCLACSAALGAVASGTCTVLGQARVCRAAVDGCDAPEQCDGVNAACPADLGAPNGLACQQGACLARVCVPGLVPDAGLDAGSSMLDGGISLDGDAGSPRPPLNLRVGCGCDASSLAPLATLIVALTRRRRFSRRAVLKPIS
ncbi:MAG: hypothetical protein SFW67_08540 [Myxococcaceae bacterium]|nr:hypothetical protein [Myxococcaceae bacterium]